MADKLAISGGTPVLKRADYLNWPVITEDDPNTGAPHEDAYPGNNGGPEFPVYLQVVRPRPLAD